MMILRSLSKDNRSVEIPRLDVDVSNVAHIMAVKCSTYESLVNDVASYLKDLAYETGFCVTAVFDGDTRPHTKRDSFKRRFDHAMKITNSTFCRHSAMAIARKEQKSSEDLEKLSALNIEAKKLDDSRLMIATEFCEDLKGRLLDIMAHDENGSNGGYVSRDVIKAEYQADYVMALRFRSKECDLILSTDMDFSAIAGPNCICIKNMKTITEKVSAGEKRKEPKSPCLLQCHLCLRLEQGVTQGWII